jgi:hypothetical protein
MSLCLPRLYSQEILAGCALFVGAAPSESPQTGVILEVVLAEPPPGQGGLVSRHARGPAKAAALFRLHEGSMIILSYTSVMVAHLVGAVLCVVRKNPSCPPALFPLGCDLVNPLVFSCPGLTGKWCFWGPLRTCVCVIPVAGQGRS